MMFLSLIPFFLCRHAAEDSPSLNLIQMKAVSMLDEDLAIPSTADPDAPPAVAALQVSASHPRLNKYGNIGNIPIIPDCPAYPEEYMLFLDFPQQIPGHLSKDIQRGGWNAGGAWVSKQGFDCYHKNIYTKNGEVHQGIPVYETGAASCKTACQFSAGSRCTIKMWRHGDYWSLGPSDLYATQPSSGKIIRKATCLPSYDYNDMVDAAQKEIEVNNHEVGVWCGGVWYGGVYHEAATDCNWMTSFDGWGTKCVGVYRMNGPTPSPTPSPTPYPTPSPTPYPTQYPTPAPTQSPTSSPTTATTTTISLEGLNNNEARVEVNDEETNNHECLSWCYSKKHKDKLWTGDGGKCKWYACSTCEECVPSPP